MRSAWRGAGDGTDLDGTQDAADLGAAVALSDLQVAAASAKHLKLGLQVLQVAAVAHRERTSVLALQGWREGRETREGGKERGRKREEGGC